MEECRNCSKQYFCKIKDIKKKLEPINCVDFKSWRETNNYGIPRRIADEARRKDKIDSM